MRGAQRTNGLGRVAQRDQYIVAGWVRALVAAPVVLDSVGGGAELAQLLVAAQQHLCIVDAWRVLRYTAHPQDTLAICGGERDSERQD